MEDDEGGALERWAAKKRRPWEEKQAQDRRPRRGELTLYHGRAEGDEFEPQIHTCLTPDDDSAWKYALRFSIAGYVYTVELDGTGLNIQEVPWDWRDGLEGNYPTGMDVAIYDDGFVGEPHKSYLLVTEAAVRAVRVGGEERFHWWCVRSEGNGCRGEAYKEYDEALDKVQSETDSISPADECPAGHSIEPVAGWVEDFDDVPPSQRPPSAWQW